MQDDKLASTYLSRLDVVTQPLAGRHGKVIECPYGPLLLGHLSLRLRLAHLAFHFGIHLALAQINKLLRDSASQSLYEVSCQLTTRITLACLLNLAGERLLVATGSPLPD